MNEIQLNTFLSLPRTLVMSPEDMVNAFMVSKEGVVENPALGFKRMTRDYVREHYPDRRNFCFKDPYKIVDGVAEVASFRYMGSLRSVYYSITRSEFYSTPR